MTNRILNIASYRFVGIPGTGLEKLRSRLFALSSKLDLKGTILLSTEGVNLFLAGEGRQVEIFWQSFTAIDLFIGMQYKASYSTYLPFRRLVVKIKSEIISLGVKEISPHNFSGKRIKPRELKKWLDEGKALTLIDTRNDFEVQLGTFEGAGHLGISSFRNFSEAAKKIPPELKEQPVVLFCTGGIRCEKAAPLMERDGFKQVLQLEGGILKYFEACGNTHYNGECFVFDDRIALDKDLRETGTVLCEKCQYPATLEEQKSNAFSRGKGCTHCL